MDSNELLKKLIPGFTPEESFSPGMLVSDPAAALKAQTQVIASTPANPDLERMKELLNKAQSRSVASTPSIPSATPQLPAAAIPEAPSVQADIQQIDKAEEAPAPQSDLTYADLQKALDAKNNIEFGGGLLRGGNMIAEAFSQGRGGNFKVDPGVYADIARRAQAPVDDFKTKLSNVDSIGMSDPTSDISRFAREQAQAQMKKLNPEFDISKLDKMSAAQLEKLGFKFSPQQSSFADRVQQTDYETLDGQPLVLDPTSKQYRNLLTGETHTGEVRRKILQGFFDPRSGERVLTDSRGRTTQIGNQSARLPEQEQEAKRKQPLKQYEIEQRLSPKKIEDLKKEKERFEKETNDTRAKVYELQEVQNLVRRGLNNPADMAAAGARISRLYEKGVLTDQDVKRYVVREGIFNKPQDFFSKAASGTFSSDQAKSLVQSIDAYGKDLLSGLDKRAGDFANDFAGRLDPQAGITAQDLKLVFEKPAGPVAGSKTQDLINSRSNEDNLKRLQELKAKYGR